MLSRHLDLSGTMLTTAKQHSLRFRQVLERDWHYLDEFMIQNDEGEAGGSKCPPASDRPKSLSGLSAARLRLGLEWWIRLCLRLLAPIGTIEELDAVGDKSPGHLIYCFFIN
jgi:hypothetical protein